MQSVDHGRAAKWYISQTLLFYVYFGPTLIKPYRYEEQIVLLVVRL